MEGYENHPLWRRYEHCRERTRYALAWVRNVLTSSPEFRVACDHLLRCELDEDDAYKDFRGWLSSVTDVMG